MKYQKIPKNTKKHQILLFLLFLSLFSSCSKYETYDDTELANELKNEIDSLALVIEKNKEEQRIKDSIDATVKYGFFDKNNVIYDTLKVLVEVDKELTKFCIYLDFVLVLPNVGVEEKDEIRFTVSEAGYANTIIERAAKYTIINLPAYGTEEDIKTIMKGFFVDTILHSGRNTINIKKCFPFFIETKEVSSVEWIYDFWSHYKTYYEIFSYSFTPEKVNDTIRNAMPYNNLINNNAIQNHFYSDDMFPTLDDLLGVPVVFSIIN